MFRKRIVAGAITLTVFLGIALLWSAASTEPLFLRGLEANGYESFVRASKLVERVDTPTNTGEFGAYLASNRPAFQAVREGLKLRSELPARFYERHDLGMDVLASFKALGRGMRIEGQHAEAQSRYSDAANTYLDVIRFGQKVEAGPLIHLLLGLSLEALGLRDLERIEPHLNAAERARVAAELKALHSARLPFEEILDRERYFMRRNSATPFHYFMGLYMTKAPVAKARSKHEKHGADMERVTQLLASDSK